MLFRSQGLRPNRSFSDGASLPSSFDDVHRRQRLESAAPELNPDVAAKARDQSRRVSAFGNASPSVPETPSPSTARSEIQGRAAEIRAQAESSQRGFDSKAEIVRAPDGTVTTKELSKNYFYNLARSVRGYLLIRPDPAGMIA